MLSAKFPDFVEDKRDLLKALERIARAIVDRRVDFLFGAGMSVAPPSSVPTGKALGVKLLQRFFEDEDVPAGVIDQLASTVPFECIAQAVENLPGKKRKDLTPFLRAALINPSPQINKAHQKFLTVYNWEGQHRVRRIYTTNFDKLLEAAFATRGETVTEENAQDIDSIESAQRVPVLHLHGTLDQETYQITESDLYPERFRKLHSRFETALREADAFVFVGYSMLDPDFRRIYLRYQNDIAERSEDSKDSYVVGPVETAPEYHLGRAIWKGRRAIWIPLDAASFFDALKEILESKTTKEIEIAIMNKYHLKDAEAYGEKVAQTASILEIPKTEAIQFLYETRTITGQA